MASSDEWWLIQDVNDPNRQGWASRRYLTAIAMNLKRMVLLLRGVRFGNGITAPCGA